MTKFREAAISISKRLDENNSICRLLYWGSDENHFFTSYFKPTFLESCVYRQHHNYWMCGEYNKINEDNEFRILALLFCEQLWLDYKKH